MMAAAGLAVGLVRDTAHKAPGECEPMCRRRSTDRSSRESVLFGGRRDRAPLTPGRQTIHEAVIHLAHDRRPLASARLAGSRVRQASIRPRSDRLDIAACRGRNAHGSCSSTSGTSLRIKPPLLIHKTAPRWCRPSASSDGTRRAKSCGSRQYQSAPTAVLFSRVEPRREHLAVPAPEPSRQPRLQKLYRYC